MEKITILNDLDGCEYGDAIIKYLESLGGINGNELNGFQKGYFWLKQFDSSTNITCTETRPSGYKLVSLVDFD